ncbi:MAG: PKD domain-containing protein [Planctomycetes bacterium]|nr:PKD domain-containing protein [Planctomycetota bacterium]
MSLRLLEVLGMGFLTSTALGLLAPVPGAQVNSTGALITGTIDYIELDNINDVFSGGEIVVGGQLVTVPRNLLIDLPANRLTLQQLFVEAPPAALSVGKSGLAVLDGAAGIPGFATILANRSNFGNAIAGEVFIEKGPQTVQGMVTFINHTDGYLRIDGNGDNTTGLMVRINDPEGRYTIQQGAGCDGGPNCSPDPRFGVDPDNYTITFTTGYPAGIPSTVPLGLRSGFSAGDNPAAAANASGVGDPFCPDTNRTTSPVPNSTRFAPIRVGDVLNASGNFELVNGVRFLSCHSMKVFAALTTINSPTQPDYLIWEEVEWDVPNFANDRIRTLLIGFSTLPDSQLDVFALHVNRANNQNVETVIGSTVGNPDTVNQGIGATAGGIFKIRYDVDFAGGGGDTPCENLINAGFGARCPGGGTLAENIAVVSPVSRELMGRSRHKAVLLPGVITRDVNGNQAPNGEYLTPVGLGHPEFGEIDLGAFQTPFNFDGLPWNLDRRLGPGGCVGNCGNLVGPLEPFPWSGIDPRGNLPAAQARPLAFFPFGVTNVLAWPPTAPGSLPILPTPGPGGPGDPAAAPVANFSSSAVSGTAPLVVNFTDLSTGNRYARLWDFGDGAFSVLQNPTHTFTTAGAFSVSLTAFGPGGLNTKLTVVSVAPPGGPGAPTANFSVNRTAGNVPLTVNFTNLSTGEQTSWLWNFGDGSTSVAQSPAHTYTTAGLFTVSLTATGPGGSDTVTRLNLINANVPGGLNVDFTADVTAGAAPLRVRFRAINVTGVASTGVFNFGDGTSGNVSAGNGRIVHTYAAPGVYTVTLTATDGVNTDVEQKVGFITVSAALRRK